MITIYKINLASSSTKKTLEWFDTHHIPYKSYPLLQIKKRDLKKILQLSDGFQSILRSTDKALFLGICDESFEIEEASTTEMVEYILKNPYVLKTPIIFDDKHLLIGYNATEIRQFIPPIFRKFSKNF